VDALFESGRLADETIIPAALVVNTIRKGKRDKLPRMKLWRVNRPRLNTAISKARIAKPRRDIASIRAPALPASGYYLVWESKDLSERDLSIPTGPTTNPTGSMLLKKGAMENIDQRTFFRNEVFEDLFWAPDAKRKHLEKAKASFELVVKDINYGKFTLQLCSAPR
ncbi:MAG: hypothetical protein ACRD41_07160, partial [Candidatus Acidiferrales bacterium]